MSDKEPEIRETVGEPNEGTLAHLLAQILVISCVIELPATEDQSKKAKAA